MDRKGVGGIYRAIPVCVIAFHGQTGFERECGRFRSRPFLRIVFIGNLYMITNIAAYKFAELSELADLRRELQAFCRERTLKGTILLSREGINLFIAGSAECVEQLLERLRQIKGLADLAAKYSETEEQPFRRMLVRLKKEIIAFGIEGIEPAKKTSSKLAAKELKQWLDEGRPVTLLDTRNDYEVRLGTFRNALPIGVQTFRQFPDAVSKLPEHLKDEPIVMFCTGGIRCEKAGPFMENEGFNHIYQLDGGILKYFEECGAAHYDGECFVFDERVGVDPGLQETDSSRCYACQSPLTKEEQADPRFVSGISCPFCFKSPEQKMAESIRLRMEMIPRHFSPLPGSVPHDNFKPVNIPADCDKFTLLDALCRIVKSFNGAEWMKRFEAGRVLDMDRNPVLPSRVVRSGQRYLHRVEQVIEPDVNVDISIIYEDEALIVVNKPAPIPMHPGGRYFLNTLQNVIHKIYAPQRPNPAHRLDANTTGIVVFTRTRRFAGMLQPQFASGGVEKEYLVRVQGHPVEDVFSCDLPISDEAGPVGLRTIDLENGKSARTEFRVVSRLDDGTAIVQAFPITGRTNQIRVHLWQLGHPVCGDTAYLLAQKIGTQQTLDLADTPLCLHSSVIRFFHPLTKERVEFHAQTPHWSSPIK
jgi:UPF0176 protein